MDRWSLAHVASGFGLAALGLRAASALAVLLAFEVVEAGLRRTRRNGRGVFENESWANVAADLFTGAMGYWMGRTLRQPFRGS